ncbi:hypothetical protein DFH11DRAFT_1873483 [Phellopilus nigrolimitatus]|nr:hypothetical protein DFH11DRAFT_1873483 [Phellopilus nigrolimitatus]
MDERVMTTSNKRADDAYGTETPRLSRPLSVAAMSSSTIARWNAIPLSRDAGPAAASNKVFSAGPGLAPTAAATTTTMTAPTDNVSLVSRSPSPEKDVEMKDPNLYDEHVRGAAREVITAETKIKSSNKGFALLAKMGWTEGSPLGITGEGRVDPIPFTVKQDSQGLGKASQDFRMIETTVSQRRNLDSERMQFESADQRQQREAAVAQKAARQSEISTVLRPFYCELCDKQFKTVAQYDEHTNSYAHHHKARTKDMNANHPMKEKERKREEKELRKMAKAVGIKMSAPTAALPAPTTQPAGGEGKGFKKSGWASTSAAGAAAPPSSSSGGSGWAAVSSPAPPSAPRGSSWQAPPPSSAPPPPPPPPSSSTASAVSGSQGFRSGGWATLATSSEEPAPPTPSASGSGQRGGWARAAAPAQPEKNAQRGGWASAPAPPAAPPPVPSAAPPAPPHSSWARLPGSGGTAPSAPPPPPSSTGSQTPVPPVPAPAPRKPDARPGGSWQSFQKVRGRR